MKKLNLFVIATLINLLSSNLFAQNVTDTVFLLKEKSHTIFIEPNKNSVNYEYFSDFSSFPKKTVKTTKILEISSKWVPLYQYKNKYFLYRPCDLGTNFRICLSNNKIAFEGFEINLFNIGSKLKKSNDTLYKLSFKDPLKGVVKIEIQIIDKEKGVAVFKYISSNDEISYQLMIDSNKLKLFQIIVNDCIFSKAKEFEFDKIDFQKIIGNSNFKLTN